MINATPLARFQSLAEGRLVRPLYEDYAFGNIPNTVEYLLTGAQRGPLPPPDKVVLVFIDSFGWQFWLDYHARFRATRLVVDKGTLTPVSALFPTTTAASVSTMNLGVLPSRHALYEWNIYIPAYGEVIQSLAFTPLGRHSNDACLRKGYDPAALIAVHETLHQRLARQGVRSLTFAHRSYAGSAYNRMVSAGAEVIAHHSLAA